MKLIKLFSLIIVVLVIGSVTMSNRSVDESIVVANLDKQISTLQDQNTILKAQVASTGALTNLSDKIAAEGFTESPTIASIHTATSVVALR